MSAEVAIIKNDCVVLAADSAVTIGGKHYNSACKLFKVAEGFPVGFMNYGSEAICGFSSTTLLKMFRKHLDGKQLPHLADYPTAFVQFLKQNTKIFFMEKTQLLEWVDNSNARICKTLQQLARGVSDEDFTQYDETKVYMKDSVKQKLLKSLIRERILCWKTEKPCWNLDSAAVTLIQSTIRKGIVSCIKSFDDTDCVFEEKDLVGDTELQELLSCLFIEEYLKTGFAGTLTGLVFAGYGTEDLYPSVSCLEIDGVVNDQIKYRYNEDKCYSVAKELTAKDNVSMSISQILSFAQADEMVELYTEGISSSFRDNIAYRLESVLAQHKISDKKAKAIVEELQEEIDEYSWTNYSDGLLGNIGLLPPEETAQLAELLIKLTSFRQHVADEAEEVAEPIDVAVISKADGFVWHKRKNSIIQP